MGLSPGIRRVNVRFDPEMGEDGTFLMRCDSCVTANQASAYWPITKEFWDTDLGLQRCRACQRARRRSATPHSREFLRARERRYYKKHREKRRAYARNNYREHRAEIQAQRRANYAAKKAREADGLHLPDDRAGAEGSSVAA